MDNLGQGARELSIFYNVDKGNNSFEQTKNPVWTKKNNHGDHWQFAQVSYEGGNQSIANFIIQGYASSSSTGKSFKVKILNLF